MKSNKILKGIRTGIKETAKYILSHHEPREYSKCYLLKINNKKLFLCSRCLGIYIGIVLGILIYLKFDLEVHTFYFLITLLPLFALLDWFFTKERIYIGNNLYRSISGCFLGTAYVLGLIQFVRGFPDYYVLFTGLVYILIVLTGLYLLSRQKP